MITDLVIPNAPTTSPSVNAQWLAYLASRSPAPVTSVESLGLRLQAAATSDQAYIVVTLRGVIIAELSVSGNVAYSLPFGNIEPEAISISVDGGRSTGSPTLVITTVGD
jgi:hypothetical protein